jgi:hypothetical protein
MLEPNKSDRCFIDTAYFAVFIKNPAEKDKNKEKLGLIIYFFQISLIVNNFIISPKTMM